MQVNCGGQAPGGGVPKRARLGSEPELRQELRLSGGDVEAAEDDLVAQGKLPPEDVGTIHPGSLSHLFVYLTFG